jgi:hypothetical protein
MALSGYSAPGVGLATSNDARTMAVKTMGIFRNLFMVILLSS